MNPDPNGLFTILIVDDDPASLHELGAALSPVARVRVALSGREAIDLLSSGHPPPDLILLDILMPDMDGYETCRCIRNLPFAREIPVIFITSLDSRESRIKALEGGALDFITKPFQMQSLRRKVANHLELQNLRNQALFQARRELRENAETHRALLGALPDVVMRFDLEGNYLFVSDNVGRIVDMQAGEFIGKSLKEYGFPGRSVTQWDEAVRRTIATGEPLQTEISFNAKTGTVVHEWRLVPEFDEAGKVVSVLTICRDVTEKRRSEELVRKGATMMEAQAGLVSVLSAGESNFGDMARAVHKWAMHLTGSTLGFTTAIDPGSGEIENHALTAAVTAEGCTVPREAAELPWKAGLLGVSIAAGRGFFTNALHEHPAFTGLPQGHAPIRRFLAAPALYRGQVMGQIALANPDRDFTDDDLRTVTVLAELFALAVNRLLSTLDLQRAKDQAEAANRARNEFLANMSHEIRTPLNGIQGMLQLIQDGEFHDEQREYAKFAMQSCRRLTNLLTGILNLSRIESSFQETSVDPFDLHDTLRAVTELFSSAAREKGIGLVLDISPELPTSLAGDGQRLVQILNNLVGNAIKFTTEGFVELSVSPLPGQTESLCRILFTVRDTGIGIPDDRLGELFEPFAQVARGFTRSHQGAGLGLAVTKRLVRLLGGSISISSEEGYGTEIAVCLPYGRVLTDGDRVGKIGSLASRNDLGLRVLLAEDDAISRYAAVRMLQRLGCVVTVAENGRIALETLLKQEFDIVFMDIQMPVLDGIQATHIIRTSPEFRDMSSIPIVALTAYADEGDAASFAEAGMNMRLSKPVRLENVAEAILLCVRGGITMPHPPNA